MPLGATLKNLNHNMLVFVQGIIICLFVYGNSQNGIKNLIIKSTKNKFSHQSQFGTYGAECSDTDIKTFYISPHFITKDSLLNLLENQLLEESLDILLLENVHGF